MPYPQPTTFASGASDATINLYDIRMSESLGHL